MIERDTEVIDCWDSDPDNMSGPAFWTEIRRTKAGDNLSRAKGALTELDRLIAVVLDHRASGTYDG